MAASVLQAPACVGLSSFALSSTGSRTRASQCSAPRAGVSRNSRVVRAKLPTLPAPSSFGFLSSSITETRLQGKQMGVLDQSNGCGSGGGALGATCNIPVQPEQLRWVFVAAAAVLLFIKNISIPKQFLVPLLALEVPRDALGWIKGDYGLWTAFLALAVKLFYRLPAELELPLYLLLIVITAPFQLTQYRGTVPAAVATLAIAGYLAYEHYKATGSLKSSFQGEKIFQSIALVILVAVPIVYLVNGVVST